MGFFEFFSRKHEHEFVAVEGKCEEECKKCHLRITGNHKWDGCICTRCGETRHMWVNEKCSKCGLQRINKTIDNSQNEFKIDSYSDSVTIKEYIGKSNNVVIPSKINNLPVENISDFAFHEKGIENIKIPETIKSIGMNAFDKNRLTELVIPDSVITIGWSAFADNQLKNVQISKNLKSIEECVFSNNKLKEIIIPDSVTFIGYRAFVKNQLVSIVIPSSVKIIGNSAFIGYDDNIKLKELILQEGLEEIGTYSFNSNDLQKITLPKSLKRIGESAFSKNKIQEIEIFSEELFIDVFAFMDNPLNIVYTVSNIELGKGWPSGPIPIQDFHSKKGTGTSLNGLAFGNLTEFFINNNNKPGIYSLDDVEWNYKSL